MEQNKDKNKTKTLGKEENEGKKKPKAITPHTFAYTCGLVTLSYLFFLFLGGGGG